MKEITITTNKISNMVNGHFHVWGWEVPLYLFLGGLTAGILIIASVMAFRKKKDSFALSSGKLSLWAPFILSLGMVSLFLDIKHKLFVWRFYTAFEITSPMSWGSWVLLMIYPLSFLLILATIRESYPGIFSFINKFLSFLKLDILFRKLTEFSEENYKIIAGITIPFAITLGIYTGILLSAFGSRPFWNSSMLGPLFLVSGLSSAVAMVILLSKEHKEKSLFTKVDIALLLTEGVFILLFLIGLATSSSQYKAALTLVTGGALTSSFWIFIVMFGLFIPALLEVLELKGRNINPKLAPVLVIAGGLFLRFIIVEAGQMNSWLPY
ncbi:MAG: polysulfide reductase NrfD [Candidatus Aminicenantes bacterium]|nr:polysulfide reductase NrfD [Candidatus Aminicenantes bacterium]